MNPSTESLLEGVDKIPAETVFILPNNSNIIMAAQQCAALTEKRVVDVYKRQGIVDEDGVILAGRGHHFHPPLHMGHSGQNSGALSQRHAQRQSGAQHIQRIIYHKTAGNANPYRYFFFIFHRCKRNVIRLETDVLRPQMCIRDRLA